MTAERADDGENFVSRWSRRKIEAREAELAPAQAPAPHPPTPGDAAAPAVEAEPPLPPVESLQGLASEYRGFLRPGVDDNLRRAALKKLFADPHFENFERFEAYCEDYTQGEPIPLAMLKNLNHAKGLLFDDEEEKKDAGETPQLAAVPAEELPRPPHAAPVADAGAPAPAVPVEEKKSESEECPSKTAP